MHTCLALLNQITEAELKGNAHGDLSKKLKIFLYYMRLDFSLITPIGLDPIKLSENIIESVYFVTKAHPKLLQESMLKKLDLIFDIIHQHKHQVEQSQGDSSLEYQIQRENETNIPELYSAIHTVMPAAMSQEASEELIIKNHMNNILTASHKNNLHAAIIGFMDFGKFLTSNYPDASLKDIKKKMATLRFFRDEKLPSFEVFCHLFKAGSRLSKEVESNENLNMPNVIALNGFKNGLNIFEFLLGKKRVQNGLSEVKTITEGGIDVSVSAIKCHLPAQQIIRSNLQVMNSSISKAKFVLTEKLNYLERKLERIRGGKSGGNVLNISQRKTILQNAMDSVDGSIVNNANLSTFTQDLQDLINSNKMITADMLNQLHVQFEQLVQNKIILPLKKYNEERGFVSRFQRWASDTLKRTFGVGKLSTYATLFDISKEKMDFFDMGIRLSKNIIR